MLFIRLIRYLQGYVFFTIKGKFPERFLNLTAKAGIGLWNIRRNSNEISAAIYMRQYRSLRLLARKSSTRLRVKKRCGFPFLVRKYGKRPGIFLGLLVCIGILYGSTLFIWSINISGCTTLDQAEVRETLRGIGVSVGVLQKDVDEVRTAEKMMLEISELGWISVNNKGTSINVEIYERTDSPEKINGDSPCNIKARREGQIKALQVYQGNSVVNVGDAVAAGDLLISGVVENADFTTSIYHAQADIIAITKHSFSIEVPLSETLRTPTGKTATIRRLQLFNVEFPLTLTTSPRGNWDYEPVRKQWNLFGFELPAAVLEENWYEYTEEIWEISQEEAIERGKGLLLKASQKELSGITVTDISTDVKKSSKSIVIETIYTCEENIGVQIGFEVEDGEEK